MSFNIKKMHLSDLKGIYDRILQDFADGEYPPYDMMYHQISEGIQNGYIFLTENVQAAYAVCTGGGENGFALISLFAVFEEMRGMGIGSAFIEKLKQIYSDCGGIIVEVEKPEFAQTSQDKAVRESRIRFYEKAGFKIVPDIEYMIWGIPMHLMTLPLKVSDDVINNEIGQIIYDIYLKLMGSRYIHQMKIKQLEHK